MSISAFDTEIKNINKTSNVLNLLNYPKQIKKTKNKTLINVSSKVLEIIFVRKTKNSS